MFTLPLTGKQRREVLSIAIFFVVQSTGYLSLQQLCSLVRLVIQQRTENFVRRSGVTDTLYIWNNISQSLCKVTYTHNLRSAVPHYNRVSLVCSQSSYIFNSSPIAASRWSSKLKSPKRKWDFPEDT